ncbi:MAG: tRNA (N(6)-L-threonylcarbamoyladenosine(37)-C(2))-methylthiotransferase MtaB [Tannerella sp.]|jgi:threonylcarbamoyladenosine tRNA methylthiotransferase MtaB|nr:tRNA (N(6)-L-threonylcarbamoyladenosine(37)-C(2))-methylthiotransferase MtaB [Tannerella sp.]
MTDNTFFENKKAAYFTLGCKLNFAETSTVGRELSSLGIRKARAGEEADFCIINTCSVTELADKKCRNLIRRVHRMHPQAYIIVTGCYAQLKPEEIASIEGVDLVLGMEQKRLVGKYIGRMLAASKVKSAEVGIISTSVKHTRSFTPSCSAGDRTRYFLKVQDGCDCFCSYCAIPFARGRSRNGSIAHIVAQARQAAGEGGREIILTGVNIGDFGKSTNERFIDLIKALDRVDGIERFRISSIEPDLLTDEIIDFVAASRRFMPHFHIPLQSGSDAVLRLMRRRYDTALFRRITERIREIMPDTFIGIDVIAGMRGETDELFDQSLRFIESLPFSCLHVFNYSERPGTRALKIDHHVPPEKRRLRSRRLIELSDRRLHLFYDQHIGRRANVLFEHSKKDGFMYGFTENYIKTEIPYDKTLCNVIRRVELTGWNADKTALTAKIID